MSTSKFKKFWKSENTPVGVRIFEMVRQNDESGHSGTGVVLHGVIFPSGKTVVCWDPEDTNVLVNGEVVNSIAVFDSFEAFSALHITQHPTNGTLIRYLN